jgi:hypothetical protein
MTWRTTLTGLLGLVLWWFLFFAIGIGFGLVWPEYREAARMMFESGDTSGYRTPLLLLNLVLFTLIGLATGWFAAYVGRSRMPGLMIAALLLLYMLITHYLLEWDSFPAWYNLIVPWIAVGAIVAGNRLAAESPPVSD